MTEVELKYLNVVPNELRRIADELEALNKNMAVIANALNNANKSV